MPARRAALVVALIGTLVAITAGCSGTESLSPSTTVGTAPPGSVTTTTEVPLDAGKQLFVYTPSVGDCFDKRKIPGQNGKQTDIVLKLDCTLPHHFEVFGIIEYPLGGPKSTELTTTTTTTTTVPTTTTTSTSTTRSSSSGITTTTTSTTTTTMPTTTTTIDTSYPGDEELRRFGKHECPPLFKDYVGIGFEVSKYEMGYLLPSPSTWPSVRRLACYLTNSEPDKTIDQPARDSKV